ncbi:MAG: hypothetical protein SPL22_05095 [Treponema sp.]|uniref:hypothetical protein n=1 Tax=Treponema sp. TaxID=166 RepID=UPI002A91D2F2|nr:hypothetical protein [Treponema sp.]MDY6397088.1 hypothetical protein [Treponema sp.]
MMNFRKILFYIVFQTFLCPVLFAVATPLPQTRQNIRMILPISARQPKSVLLKNQYGSSLYHKMDNVAHLIKGPAMEDASMKIVARELKAKGYKDYTRYFKNNTGNGFDGLFLKINKKGEITNGILYEVKSGVGSYNENPFGFRKGFKEMTENWFKDVVNSFDSAPVSKSELLKAFSEGKIKRDYLAVNLNKGHFIIDKWSLIGEKGNKLIFGAKETFLDSKIWKRIGLTKSEKNIKGIVKFSIAENIKKQRKSFGIRTSFNAKRLSQKIVNSRKISTWVSLTGKEYKKSFEYFFVKKTRLISLQLGKKLGCFSSKLRLNKIPTKAIRRISGKAFKGVLKAAPILGIVFEAGMDIHDLYSETTKYYNGTVNKQNLIINVSGVTGGIIGGFAAVGIGYLIGTYIGKPFGVDIVTGPIGLGVGAVVGAVGYFVGSFFGRKVAKSITARYFPTLKSDEYFDRLCVSVDEYCKNVSS